jgi:hypothetical protein
VTTARAIVRGALLDLQVVSAEQPIDASMVQDGLDLLNAMLDSWSLEALTVYYTPATEIPWPAGTQALTWGPGGDIPSARPLKLQPYAQYRDTATGLELPLTVLDRQSAYAAFTLKRQASSTPQVLYYAPSMPLGTLYEWPIASEAWTIVVYPWQPFGRFGHLDEDILFPPGYERAVRAGLSLESAPQYGVQPSPMTVGIVGEAKANLKRLNAVVPILGMDPSLGETTARDPYAIYTDVP